MNLQDFINQEESRVILRKVFSRGVRVIYEDALQLLSRDRELLMKLVEVKNLPEEITSSYLKNLNASIAKEDFEKNIARVEKEQEGKEKKEERTGLEFKIIKNYSSWEPATAESFFANFYSRYTKLAKMLSSRPQLKNLTSIAQISRMKGREDISVVGMVSDIRKMKDGRKIIEIEDPTGSISVLISPAVKHAETIVLDDVIGVRGQAGRGILFADEVVFPDIPLNGDWPSTGESEAFFISDIHVGSKKFNLELWERFAEYINRNRAIKYLLVSGDLVDGIGIYQGQNDELELDTAEEQYAYLADLIRKLRKDLLVIAIPGNHDPSRDGEPQPKVPKEFAEPLYKLENFVMLSNPAWVELEGIKILLYHGTSLDGLIDSIESLRNVAYEDPSKAQIELLRKRHLSPIFGRNRIFPDKEDFMIIDPVPNVFVTGHVHTTSASVYRGVRLISAGTFQERTAFQEKLGHHPTPGKFVKLDLKTGKLTIVDFSNSV